MRGKVFRNYYEGHMDKIGVRGEWKQVRDVSLVGVGGLVGGKCRNCN